MRDLRRADDLPDPGEEERDEGQTDRTAFDHRPADARWLHIHEHRRADERSVDRDLARVVRDEQDAAARNVLGAEDVAAEITAVEECDGGKRVAGPLRVEAERVNARVSERERHAGQTLLEVFSQDAGHPVVERLIRRGYETLEERPRAARECAEASERACRFREVRHDVVITRESRRTKVPGVTFAYPPTLAPGDRVAVVAPSSPFEHREFWGGL